MKFKISIEKIEEKEVRKSVYIPTDELKERSDYSEDTSNYRMVAEIDKVTEEIYAHIFETKDINDINSIIKLIINYLTQ